jgi:hypothetical protein
MPQRSSIIRQLVAEVILYGSGVTFSVLAFYDGTWMCFVFMASQALTNIINRTEILKYVNIVLIAKRRYQYINQLLSEAAFRDEQFNSKQGYTGCPVTYDTEKLFLPARYNVTKYRDSLTVCRIYDLRIIYSELYDVLHISSRSYGVLILLDIITSLTSAVPTIYLTVVLINSAFSSRESIDIWLKATDFICTASSGLLNILWLAMCCHTTTDEIQETLVCVQKLLLYPNGLSWSTADLKRLSSQLRNLKVEFSVCGFFTLNLQFICGTVGIVMSYILVMNQFNQVIV